MPILGLGMFTSKIDITVLKPIRPKTTLFYLRIIEIYDYDALEIIHKLNGEDSKTKNLN